jgi:DNA-binding response OmpR family regulator
MFIASHPDSYQLVPPPTRSVIKRGAVTMSPDPVEIHWNGRRVPLSPIEAMLLGALLRRSRMRWEEVHGLLADHACCAESRDVLIHRIRRKFAQVGARNPIETLRGWGIRFRAERDVDGSAAFWIGAREGDAAIGM